MYERTLYLECYSGISGDMTVAALLDLGADQKVLMAGLDSLKVEGYSIKIGRREKNSISACDFDVILEEDSAENHVHGHTHDNDQDHSHHPNHDQFLEHALSKKQDHSHHHALSQESDHFHGQKYSAEHVHSHGQDGSHEHSHSNTSITSHELLSRPVRVLHSEKSQPHREHDHNHTHSEQHTPIHLGHHEHRNLSMINDIIDSSAITDRAKGIAKRIFYIVAAAEATAHGKSIDEVHFHEVGAIDSIVDIVATAICLDNLQISEVIVSELYEGTGSIECQHGTLPIPVPAVINIASAHRLPLHITSVKGEMVTPTGAAIAAAIRTKEELPKDMRILKIGLGAGKRKNEGSSGLLRAMLIEDTGAKKNASAPTVLSDRVWVLEANMDDCSGEALAYTLELLLQNGAKDAYYTPIFMKKNRPAYLLGVICGEEQIPGMERIIFTNTTTIGIRRHVAERSILSREILTVPTVYGDAQVKVCTFEDKKFYYPEFESIKKLCESSKLDYQTLYHIVQASARKATD